MKLYLSSVGFPEPGAYRALFGASKRIGFIANAWDTAPEGKSRPFIDASIKQLNTMGGKVRPIDLRQYASKTQQLKHDLQALDGIWVTGGNSFNLNWAAHQAGLHTIIRELCAAGLVYGGESAGAILATPTLHGVEFVDDANEAPETIWDGLGLTDFGVVPHWGNAKYAELLASCRQEMEKHVKVKIITDSQCLVMVGGKTTVFGNPISS